MSAVFQIIKPALEYTINFLKFIRTLPAGIEITERTPGIMRPKNTAGISYFTKNPVALWKSFPEIATYPPYLRKNFSSFAAGANQPSANQNNVPIKAPRLAVIKARKKLSSPLATECPTNGNITSDGIGGNKFSATIKTNTPQ